MRALAKTRRWAVAADRSFARLSVALLLPALLAGPAWGEAALTVIYDSGHTRALAPLLDSDDEAARDPTQAHAEPDLQSAPPLPELNSTALLPIRTPELIPGVVSPGPLALANGAVLPRPLFLVGSDPASLQWLARQRDALAAAGAIGMLVEAASAEDLAAVAKAGAGLPILPAAASDIARALGLRHIPVLLSRDGITQ